MSAGSAAIAGPADMTLEDFRRVLEAYSSPALAEASGMYDALRQVGVRQSVFLAFFLHESRAGTLGVTPTYETKNPGNVRSVADPASGGVVIDTPRGPFVRYPSWTAGTLDWAKRLRGSLYEGVGLRTVAQVIPKYAPATDSNDPEAYIRAVEALVKRYSRVLGGGMVQQPPVVVMPSPNSWLPDATRQVEAIVNHITQGTNSLPYLRDPANSVSSNYLIARDGTIYELVEPRRGSAWANGPVKQPDMANPLVASWFTSGINPNRRTVSIEHEGFTSNERGGSLTAAQWASTVALQAWLCQEFALPADREHILGHYQINLVDKQHCPGFSAEEWDRLVREVAARVAGARPATFSAAWQAGGPITARWRAWRVA